MKIIGVIGSGTMGNGIAHVFSMCSKVKQVVLVDLNDNILSKAKLIISKNLDRQIKKNIINRNDAKAAYDKILFTSNIEDIAPSDIVIEAVKEDLKVKKTIFSHIDRWTSSDCILATNTSSIPNPAQTAMGPKFTTTNVMDRRRKKELSRTGKKKGNGISGMIMDARWLKNLIKMVRNGV